MKTTRLSAAKALLPVAAALAAFSNPAAHAESTYGYNAAGTGTVSATAKVNLRVVVPKLILLRVGPSGAFDAAADRVTLTGAPSPGIPGGIAAGALADGNSLASGWDGTAPAMSATASPANVTAYLWTNNAAGASLAGAVTSGLNTGNLTPTMITVGNSGTMTHPGANLGSLAPVTLATPNTVFTATWTYGISDADLATLTAGQHDGQVTYTATSL